MKAIKDLIESIKCRKVRGNWSFYQFHVWRLYRKYVEPFLYKEPKPKTMVLQYNQLISRRDLMDSYAIDLKEHYKRRMIESIIYDANKNNWIEIEEYEHPFTDGIELKARLEIVIK
jgi:hypothetical protein